MLLNLNDAVLRRAKRSFSCDPIWAGARRQTNVLVFGSEWRKTGGESSHRPFSVNTDINTRFICTLGSVCSGAESRVTSVEVIKCECPGYNVPARRTLIARCAHMFIHVRLVYELIMPGEHVAYEAGH